MTRQWRIGAIAGGISLIGFGVLILLISYGAAQWSYLKYLWPIVMIVFGLEVILHSRGPRETRARFSVLGIVLVVLVSLASLGGYTVSKAAQVIGLSGVPLAGTANSNVVLVPVNGSLNVNSSVHNVNIQVPNADVTVMVSPGNQVVYKGELGVPGNNQTEGSQNLKSEWQAVVQGDTVELILNQPNNHTLWSLFNHNWNNTKGSLTIQMPASLYTKVHTVNGSITVNGVTNGVDAQTVNGAVTVNSVSGRVSEDAVNGTLTANQINGDVQMHAVNGTINVHQVSGSLNVDEVNGSASVQSSVGGNWQLKTVNGGLNLTLPQGTNAAIDARSIRSISGNVSWQLNGGVHHATAILGSGTHTISLNTTNGAITVNQVG